MSELDPRARVVAEAHRWLGTPFHHAARILGVGVDCAQLIIAVYSAARLMEEFDPDPYPPDYGIHSRNEAYLREITERCDPLPPDQSEWRPGDILTYRLGRTTVSHAAIYVGEGWVIHAFCTRRTKGEVQKERVSSRFLATRFTGAWRLKTLQGVA